MNELYVQINGELLLQAEAKISINDLSILRGYGVFDFFLTRHHQPLLLDDHLDRLYNSAHLMHLDMQFSREELTQLIYQLMEKNQLVESGIRITLTGGNSDDGYRYIRPNLIITETPFIFDENNFKKGLRLMTWPYQRQLAQVKTIDYLQAIYLQPSIRGNQADDVLYHHDGELRECPRSNFFIVNDRDEIITPSAHVLPGITRKRILGLTDYKVTAVPIPVGELATIKEAFISSTTRKVVPVLAIDGRQVGTGLPGRLTKEIYSRLS